MLTYKICFLISAAWGKLKETQHNNPMPGPRASSVQGWDKVGEKEIELKMSLHSVKTS